MLRRPESPATANETQRALVDAIRASPGASVAELAQRVGIAHTTATYHLRRMEKRGSAVSMRQGGRLHWFLNGQASGRERTLAICRRLDRSVDVLARVPRDRSVPLGVVARGLPMTKAGVYWHLERLTGLGLVVAEGPAGARLYRAAADVAIA